jgi:putative component of membrane protein insertase Oxa1/YidC/SpoIIIJ protein YidD
MMHEIVEISIGTCVVMKMMIESLSPTSCTVFYPTCVQHLSLAVDHALHPLVDI